MSHPLAKFNIGVLECLEDIPDAYEYPPTSWPMECTQGDKYSPCFEIHDHEEADIHLLMCVGHALRYSEVVDQDTWRKRRLMWNEAFARERESIAWMAFAKDVGCGELYYREVIDGQYQTLERTTARDHVEKFFNARMPAKVVGNRERDIGERVELQRERNANKRGEVAWKRNHLTNNDNQVSLF